jgi:hypothetical protein
MTTSAEHVKWCKTRALEYIEAGDAESAFRSMVSDMQKHEETAAIMAPLAVTGMVELMQGGGVPAVKRWIEDF